MLKWFTPQPQRFEEWLTKNKGSAAWHVLDFNQHSFRGHDQVLHFERHHSDRVEILNLYPQTRHIELITNDKLYFQTAQWKELLVENLERHIALKLKDFTETLKKSPPTGGDQTQEARGEEWLKTSLLVLERALNGLGEQQRLQCTWFCGQKDGLMLMRVIIFNLDLSFTYHHDKTALQVTCFNKKDAAEFNYQKADFDGVFVARAFPVFDQAIKLMQKISEAVIRECLR